MALPATHIKFALDLATHCDVQDTGKYILGTLYPDSQYITGIDASSMHYSGLIAYVISDDDFMNGWAVHFLCDETQRIAFKKYNEEYADLLAADRVQAEILANALKIVQEFHTLQGFHVLKYVGAIDQVEARSNEQIELVQKYYRDIAELYSQKGQMEIDDFVTLYADWGASLEDQNQIRDLAKRLETDAAVQKSMQQIYEEMISLAVQKIENARNKNAATLN